MLQLQPNPSGTTTILLMAAVVGGAWLLFSKKSEPKTTVTTPTPPAPTPPAPTPPTTEPICKVTQVMVDQWAKEKNLFVVWADKETGAPPNFEGVKQAFPDAASLGAEKIVVVTKNGDTFWAYGTNGNPIVSRPLRDNFCLWKKLLPLNGVRPTVYASIW